jgi:aminoglycoside phosphotransferase (APT) family kinase protein
MPQQWPAMLHTDLKTLVAEAVGAPMAVVTLTPRPTLQHFANQLYDAWVNGRHLIVKDFLRPDTQDADAAREFRALKLLAPLELAPQPVCFEPARGPTVIYEYMEGAMWDRRKPEAAELRQLAEAWLKVNAVRADGLWPSRSHERKWADIANAIRTSFLQYSAWAAAEFAVGQSAGERCLAVLESRQAVIDELAAGSPLLCFCRSDPRFANVIRRPDGRIGFVDWEGSGVRDPARELADILTHPNQEDLLEAGEWQAFVEPYLAERGGLDAELWQRAQKYLVLFPIYFLSVILNQGRDLAQRGQLAGWTVNGLPASVRLRRYLARALAWPNTAFGRELDELASVVFFPDS